MSLSEGKLSWGQRRVHIWPKCRRKLRFIPLHWSHHGQLSFCSCRPRVIYSKQAVTGDCFLLETCNVRDNSRVLTAGQTVCHRTLACSMYSWTCITCCPCFYLIVPWFTWMFCWRGQSPLKRTWCSYSHISTRILHHSRRNTHLFHTPQMGARLCHERWSSIVSLSRNYVLFLLLWLILCHL